MLRKAVKTWLRFIQQIYQDWHFVRLAPKLFRGYTTKLLRKMTKWQKIEEQSCRDAGDVSG
jgi:hypothetical protein